MPAIVTPDRASHWYTPEGWPAYEVECKSRPGHMRPTTLRDARKFGLLPSVTGITRVLAAPHLEAWKQEQVALAMATLPRYEHEPLEAFVKRAVEDAKSVSTDAASFGTDIHRAVGDYHKTEHVRDEYPDPRLRDIMLGYEHWAKKHIRNVVDMEVPFACSEGYGGKTDMVADLADMARFLLDIKSQSTKPSNKIRTYPPFGMQLAAYHRGRDLQPDIGIANLIVSSTEPSRVELVVWENINELWAAFQACFHLWRFTNNYDPRGEA